MDNMDTSDYNFRHDNTWYSIYKIKRLGVDDRYGYDRREHRNGPGVGGITQLKWRPVSVWQSPVLSPPEIAGLATVQVRLDALVPSICIEHWTLWLPLVPPHELNVTYSCTNASCVWFTECSAIFGFVTAPSESIWVVIQSTQFAFNGVHFLQEEGQRCLQEDHSY
jgi:hypothetical protein